MKGNKVYTDKVDDTNDLKRPTLDKMRLESLELKELNLTALNGKPINGNINAAWEIIEGAYCLVLEEDPKWHFFYEDSYNIIRCSYEFVDRLKAYLDECGVTYSEPVFWIDSAVAVREHQHIFCPMFHTFSMLAISGYSSNYFELYSLFDRVAHCFLNHQVFRMLPVINRLGSNWEAQLASSYAVSRAFYTANVATNVLHENINKEEERSKWWVEKCLGKIRKRMRAKKNTSLV